MSMDSLEMSRSRLSCWKMQSADRLSVDGAQISVAGFMTEGWYETRTPSTVLAALVDAGEYEDPYFGENLKAIATERFEQSWWYRNEFNLSDAQASAATILEFDGINYAANVWLNGRIVADSSRVCGAFRRFGFDVSDYVQQGGNVLAVEVIPPNAGDFSTGFVDWNPPPPDRNMGIFHSVTLHNCTNVSIADPFVQTDLDTDTLKRASLTISAELTNRSNEPVTGVLVGRIDSIAFEQAVTLAAGERKVIEFDPAQHKTLQIEQPRIWWPHDLGEPELYELGLEFLVGDVICDT